MYGQIQQFFGLLSQVGLGLLLAFLPFILPKFRSKKAEVLRWIIAISLFFSAFDTVKFTQAL